MNKEQIFKLQHTGKGKKELRGNNKIRNEARERFDRKKLPGRKVVQGHFLKYKVRTLTHEFQVSSIQRAVVDLNEKNKAIENKYVHILLHVFPSDHSTQHNLS